MAIKVTVGEQKTQNELTFPKLMKYSYTSGTYCIVIMQSNSKGCVIAVVKSANADCGDKVGNLWEDVDTNEHGWSDYNEPITLQNEA